MSFGAGGCVFHKEDKAYQACVFAMSSNFARASVVTHDEHESEVPAALRGQRLSL